MWCVASRCVELRCGAASTVYELLSRVHVEMQRKATLRNGTQCDATKRRTTHAKSLYIKRGEVSLRNVRSSVTLGVASSVANDVIMRIAGSRIASAV